MLNPKIDKVIAISAAVSDVSQVAFPEKSLRIVPTFLAEGLLDVALRQPRPSFCPEGDYILYVGSLHEHKGVKVLLDAYDRLKTQIPLVIIGSAGQAKDQPLGDGVILARDVDHDRVMGAWAHCLMGVIPSIWEEPWGQVAAEAATVGKAVVATRVGGLQEVVRDGETGILVPPNDPEAMREAMELLIESPEMRDRMGKRAADHVRPFTVARVTDQIEDAIRDLVRE